jgi:hypothetical protein
MLLEEQTMAKVKIPSAAAGLRAKKRLKNCND